MSLIVPRNSTSFPFSQIKERETRELTHNLVSFFRQQLNKTIEDIERLLNAIDDSTETDASMASLQSSISSLSSTISTLSSSVSLLSTRVTSLEDAELELTPLLLDAIFTGSATVSSGKIGYVPDGMINNGTITVNGILRIF